MGAQRLVKRWFPSRFVCGIHHDRPASNVCRWLSNSSPSRRSDSLRRKRATARSAPSFWSAPKVAGGSCRMASTILRHQCRREQLARWGRVKVWLPGFNPLSVPALHLAHSGRRMGSRTAAAKTKFDPLRLSSLHRRRTAIVFRSC